MKKPKFSIITTIHCWNELKQRQLKRCVNSVNQQSYSNFEHLIVDDGSVLELPIEASIKQPHLERVHAMREAMKLVKGDWIIFLDSDDEFFSFTLECISQMIDKNKRAKMFNYSSYHVSDDYGVLIRGAFRPEKKRRGHVVFGGGTIVNGTFVFHRSIYEKLGGFPDDIKKIDTTELNYGGVRGLSMCSPFDFSAYAQIEFPEIRPFFGTEGEPEGKVIKELGNPWGNDFYLFYKYTRKYHSTTYDIPLYIVHHDGKEGVGHHVKSVS